MTDRTLQLSALGCSLSPSSQYPRLLASTKVALTFPLSSSLPNPAPQREDEDPSERDRPARHRRQLRYSSSVEYAFNVEAFKQYDGL